MCKNLTRVWASEMCLSSGNICALDIKFNDMYLLGYIVSKRKNIINDNGRENDV